MPKTLPLKFGHASSPADCTVIPLFWEARRLDDGQSLDESLKRFDAVTGSGVYAFEGCHDSRPNGGILYVGHCKPKETISQALGKRVAQSFTRFAWRIDGEVGLFADVWNLTVRWAQVDPEIVLHVESLLITAHAPSFNGQAVRSQPKNNALRMLVLNGGAKGPLLPAVAGLYFDQPWWNALVD
jgi:hypothetical protein